MRPERILHIGLGAFFRAHQAWYTEHASDSSDWGIVAFTGRSATQAEILEQRDCVYTLLTRTEAQDRLEQIESVVRAESAANLENFFSTLCQSSLALVTITITEAGYLSQNFELEDSALRRLIMGLEARMKAGLGPLALVSCDNLPNNGEVLKRALLTLASGISRDLEDYVLAQSFVSTSVDRITPKTTEQDIQELMGVLGFRDEGLVVTEPFTDWVLSGDFPLGRPDWASAGARFVTEIEPFENRKLWLLNGSHSLMAYFGRLLGYQTVDQAIADPMVLAAVNSWWDEASQLLDADLLDLGSYRQALIERYRNPRIRHQLSQIANDGSSKLSVRIVPVAKQLLERGVISKGAIVAIGSWAINARRQLLTQDPRLDEIQHLANSEFWLEEMGKLISNELISHVEFKAELEKFVREHIEK